MEWFESYDGTQIAYHRWGSGEQYPPVVLQHGFIADGRSNWENPGVVAALVAADRRVYAIDARGHGASEKHYEPARYGFHAMTRDLMGLIDRTGADRVDLVGYSMGGIVALLTAVRDPRVRRLVVGGVGASIVEQNGLDRRRVPSDALVAALLAEDAASLDGSPLAGFRELADRLGADRQALAALLRAGRVLPAAGGLPLHRVGASTLVLVGRDDPLATRPEVLADAIAGASLRLVDGDHVSALRDAAFAPSIVDFLAAPVAAQTVSVPAGEG